MKKGIITLAYLSSFISLASQSKQGNVWVTGGGGQKIKFQGNNIITSNSVFFSTYFHEGNSSISDTNGNLILCSDGFNIYDSNANYIDGGDTLVPQHYENFYNGWSLNPQTSIFLPMDSGIYYFVTPTNSETNLCYGCPFDIIMYNVIDMNANGGAGKVVKPMQPLITGVPLSRSQMMACRHSNGKDWWLLKQGYDSNIIYKILFKQDTVENLGFQKFDAPVWGPWGDVKGQSMFSQDGSKYATIVQGDTVKGRIFMADFDRCYGILSNPKVLQSPFASTHSPNPPPFDSSLMDQTFVGLAFSPDGSKLYTMSQFNIFQYDLQDETWYHVAGLDTTWLKFQMYSNAYLGPDDKLYIGNFGGSSRQMSVINNPDVKGVGCNFCPRCLRMDTLVNGYAGTPPCMPNYSLGAQPCWPLGNQNEKEKENEGLHVYPNPASTMIHINLSAAQAGTENNTLRELYNSVGQLLVSTNENEMDIRKYSAGVYYLKVGNQVRKIIIE